MEWWDNPNENGLGQAVVGFTKEGEIYLTFDIRNNGGILTPVFSPLCKVGSPSGHRLEAYKFYRNQFMTLERYNIFPLEDCNYVMKDNPSVTIKFRKNVGI